MLLEVCHTLPLAVSVPLSRDTVWQRLWERVTFPQRWIDGVTACDVLWHAPKEAALTRRIAFGDRTFEERVTWQTGEWLRFVTQATPEYPGSLLTITLVERDAMRWSLTFFYRRFVRDCDTTLPDGTELSAWLAAAYRSADEAYVVALARALQAEQERR